MPLRNRKHDEDGRFVVEGEESLSLKNITLRLPVSAHNALYELFPESVKRNHWIRQVLVEAIKAEAEAQNRAEAS